VACCQAVMGAGGIGRRVNSLQFRIDSFIFHNVFLQGLSFFFSASTSSLVSPVISIISARGYPFFSIFSAVSLFPSIFPSFFPSIFPSFLAFL
jgi:hypothetical protein